MVSVAQQSVVTPMLRMEYCSTTITTAPTVVAESVKSPAEYGHVPQIRETGGFESPVNHPQNGFPWFLILTPGKCRDGSFLKGHGRFLPNPSPNKLGTNTHINTVITVTQVIRHISDMHQVHRTLDHDVSSP